MVHFVENHLFESLRSQGNNGRHNFLLNSGHSTNLLPDYRVLFMENPERALISSREQERHFGRDPT